jgi:NAD(P)-dependent dehydrogenase (short-subunit alcohol dehydrogenase family)
MSDQVVLITGALTGIGRAAAIIFAQEGAHIVVSGRRDKEGQALVAELQGLGAEAIFVRTDVRKDEEVRNLVDQTVKRFGRLDVAVNNAGTEGAPGPVTEQTAESYMATFDTNVLGTLLSMKHELRAMLPQGGGSIVNVSSAYGSVGAAGASVYVASKHAVEGLTKSAALEVAGTGVRVNVVARAPRIRWQRFAFSLQESSLRQRDRHTIVPIPYLKICGRSTWKYILLCTGFVLSTCPCRP